MLSGPSRPPPLLQLLPEPRQPPEALHLPSAWTVSFCQEKQWKQRRKARPAPQSARLSSGRENTRIVRIPASAQVGTGAPRWSHRPSSSLAGLRGPTDRRADRPAIVACKGVAYQMHLKKGLGLEALASPEHRLTGTKP